MIHLLCRRYSTLGASLRKVLRLSSLAKWGEILDIGTLRSVEWGRLVVTGTGQPRLRLGSSRGSLPHPPSRPPRGPWRTARNALAEEAGPREKRRARALRVNSLFRHAQKGDSP